MRIVITLGGVFILGGMSIQKKRILDDLVYAPIQPVQALTPLVSTSAFSDTQQQGWLVRFFNSPLWPF